MKKLGIVLILALAASSVLFAQAAPIPYGFQAYAQVSAQTIKIDGKLDLINGMIGLKSGSKTYYVPMLGRLSGFVESLKEGASVKVEGYEYPLAATPGYSVVTVTKLNVGGKDYDLGQFASYGMNYGRHGGMMGGRRW
ncbi:MAG: hypothetical protein NT061_00375 [Spirochaetes bacterium]|nr:hypothetical protein [Spirochaetota bacterium]